MKGQKISPEAKALRPAVVARLRQYGPHTVRDMVEALGCDAVTVRDSLCRLVKSGVARSERLSGIGPRSTIAKYHLRENGTPSRNVERPHRPVLKEYPVNQVRDPFHLPAQFFCVRVA